MSLPYAIILGSSSPRRLELLQSLFPNELISLMPPHDPDERKIDHLTTREEITQGLLQIACDKNEDVCCQILPTVCPAVILTADTGVIVKNNDGSCQLLGKPPFENYRDVVRDWFERYYLGKTHHVVSAVSLSFLVATGKVTQQFSCTVTSEVTMAANLQNRIEWYLDTKEPLGKAGGYAIQGAGSLFVEKVTGSISNIIGLPLKETLELFERVQ